MNQGKKRPWKDNLIGSNSCPLLLKTRLVAFLIAKEPNSPVTDAGVMVCVFLLHSQINEGKKLVRRKDGIFHSPEKR